MAEPTTTCVAAAAVGADVIALVVTSAGASVRSRLVLDRDFPDGDSDVLLETDTRLAGFVVSRDEKLYVIGAAGEVRIGSGPGWTSWRLAAELGVRMTGAFEQPGRGVLLYGPDATVLESPDGGASWRPCGLDLEGDVHGLAVSPRHGLLAAGTGGLFVRGPRRWRRLDATSLHAVGATDGGDAIAVGPRGVVLLADGDAWRPIKTPTTRDLHAAASYRGKLYVGAGSGGLFTFDLARRKLVECKLQVCSTSLVASSDYLLACGDAEVVRFDGDTWPFLEHRPALEGDAG